MTARQRIVGFGAMALLGVAGIVCEALARDVTAEVVGIALMLVGFPGILMLLFVEVGLSEEHDREREQRRRDAVSRAPTRDARPRLRRPRRPRRPG